jgi:hypothetical protein
LEEISKTFEEVFKQELPEFLKKKHQEITKDMRKSTLSLGLGVAGFVPCISTITTLLSLPSTSREFFINLHQGFRSRKKMNNYNLYLNNKEKTLHQMIEKYSISERSTLLDALDLLTKTISIKLKI